MFALDMLMRTLSRGQSFDVLSSQANMAGYRAVIEASHRLQQPLAGGMTAAGKINPARVLVVGAGVAGLAAIQQVRQFFLPHSAQLVIPCLLVMWPEIRLSDDTVGLLWYTLGLAEAG